MQDSFALGYPNNFAEKLNQNHINSDWTVDNHISEFDPLPVCLSNPTTGVEAEKLQLFWKEVICKNSEELFPKLSLATLDKNTSYCIIFSWC